MQKILFTLFIFFFVNTATSQYYKPKSFVQKLGYSSMPLKLKWAIKLDSNFSYPYYKLAKYNQNKRNYLTNKGSIYYYSKFFEINKKFPTSLLYSYQLIEPIKARLTAITSAFRQNPDFFKKDNKLSDFTQSELMKIVEDCVNDIEEYGLSNTNSGLETEIFETYMLKAQLDFDKNDIDTYLTTCKVILSKTENLSDYNESKDQRLKVYDDMINKFIEIGDTLSASQALNENLKVYKEEEKNNLEYRNKQKQLIVLLNHLNNISHDKYDICSSYGTDVFCRNKNVRIANYSSALKFWNIYFQENSIFYKDFNKFFNTIDASKYLKLYKYVPNRNSFQDDEFKIDYIPYIYEFYLTKGKELGMIWPLYGAENLLEKYFEDGSNTHWKFKRIIKTELHGKNDIYDIEFIMNTDMNSTNGDKYNLTFGKSDYVSDSVMRYEIIFLPRLDWYENLINIPVLFLDGNKKQFFTNKKGQTLPTSTQFKKLYEIEKQNYENEQALIRARQLQQQEEIRRLEQERLNREAQTRLIEEENERKQKEIDLVNAQNKQIENKRALENKKAEKIFWDKVFNGSSSSPSKKSSAHTCKWCSKTFSTDGFYYETSLNHSCYVREGIISSDSKYCSRECAYNACEHKSR